ncbi:MAG: ATP-dependent Clp protease adapter ClpS [Gammaproteobacteria bacterium]|nr:ATP-dependent Clp protease adapter ClpS [Gammaproteobacteria bacterium]
MSGDVVLPELEDLVDTESKSVPALDEPKKYRVILRNDDYTPMNFVILVLQQFFYMSESGAAQLTLQVHTQGYAICGVYTRDIAETKVVLVNEFARTNEHPLLCMLEQE